MSSYVQTMFVQFQFGARVSDEPPLTADKFVSARTDALSRVQSDKFVGAIARSECVRTNLHVVYPSVRQVMFNFTHERTER